MRVTRTAEETAYYQLLVSVRKRIECVFGLNKQRFRLLKTPMLFKTKSQIDNVMLTCCRLPVLRPSGRDRHGALATIVVAKDHGLAVAAE